MFCKNCGNKLDNSDRVCAVCGETVDTVKLEDDSEVREKAMEAPETEAKLAADEDIKTPLFNFKWNVQDFPNENETKTEDIEFKWETVDSGRKTSKDTLERTSVVEQMKGAVDAEKIDSTPPFSEEVEKEEPVTDDWYEPFAIKKDSDEDTLFKFNKKNEEFQELLDKEFEKYNKTRQVPTVDVNTKRYRIEDFVEEPEAPVHIVKPEELAEAKKSPEPAGLQLFNTIGASPFGKSTKAITDSSSNPSDTVLDKVTDKAPGIVTDKEPEKTPQEAKTFASPFGDDKLIDKSVDKTIEKPIDKSIDKSIDSDEVLKDLPEGEDTAEELIEEEKKEEKEEERKVVGPEIVNEPVVFPFEMKNTAELEPINPEQEQEKKAEQKAPEIAKPADEAKVEAKMPATKNEKNDEKESGENKDNKESKEGDALIKVLVAVIIVILVLLAGIGVMKFLPQTMVGQALNNFSDVVFNRDAQKPETENESEKQVPKADESDRNLDTVIKSQLSSVNRNIKAIPYDDSVGYDEKISYEIEGANESEPIKENFWKKSDNGDLLYDEQAVKAVIGYNSTWVGYVNDGYDDVFDYVVSGSNAEKTLKKEKSNKGTTVEFNKLGIGEVRQNGNKFYVWTKETITIKDSSGKGNEGTISQVYELEVAKDSLKILNVAKI